MTGMMQTRDQQLAKYAADCIGRVDKDKSDFKSIVRNLPALVMSNGLGQTLAYLKAKGKASHEQLYGFISKWVSETVYGKESDLIKLIIENDSLKYRRATQEAMALASWLKRFAEAVFH